MAANARLLAKQVPTDVWALREKLALASSVKRSGDNNWVSVNRAIRPYGESNRPSDWFSQKNCALQYSALLENVETPKRKRGEKETSIVEAPGDIIIRKLTIERIEELKRMVQEEESRYKKLKEDVLRVLEGEADDELDDIQLEIDREKKAVEDEEKTCQEELAAREAKLRHKKLVMGFKIQDIDESSQESPAETVPMEEDSNMSQNSVTTTLSSSSQDVKPPLMGDQIATTVKHEDLIAAGDIKTEPVDHDPESTDITIKEEPTEAGDGNDAKFLGDDKLEDTDMSEDNSSTHDILPPRDHRKDSMEREIFVQVVDDKEDKDGDLDSASECTGKELDEAPLSPASSVMSNDTDGGFCMVRGKGRRGRGKGSNRRGRRRGRSARGRSLVEDDRAKESETSSKADSSDDDTGVHESDDTASNATGRHQLSFTESLPNSPASIAPGDTEDEKAFKVWKKSIMLVWRAAANHKYANVFSHPVTEDIAPGYHAVVYRPLDLTKIKKNIETGAIRTTAEFQRDMMQMFTNAIMYNNSDHDVSHMANEMYDDVMRHIEQYVHTQIMVQGGDSKLLRPSRRSEVHSDKEDEPKRKRTTSDQQDGGKAKKRK